MSRAYLSVPVAGLKAKIIGVDVFIEVVDTQALAYTLSEGVFKIQEAAVPGLYPIQIRTKCLAIHL